MLDQILSTLGGSAWAQWSLFGILILCGFGFPMPEDIILVSAGFLAAQNGVPLLGSMVLMYFGIMIGDFLIFTGGRLFGHRLVNFIVKEKNRDRIQDLFRRYGTGVVFVARFLPGLRTPVFFTAGTLRFSPVRFLLMDGFAALISAPLFVWLGHWAWSRYADDIQALQKTLGKTQGYFISFVIIVAVVMFLAIWQRSRIKNKKVQHEPAPHSE